MSCRFLLKYTNHIPYTLALLPINIQILIAISLFSLFLFTDHLATVKQTMRMNAIDIMFIWAMNSHVKQSIDRLNTCP